MSGGLVRVACVVGFVVAGCSASGSSSSRGADGGPGGHGGSSTVSGTGGHAGTKTPGADGGVTEGDSGPAGPPPVVPICSKDGWCWEHPSVQGQFLYGVWASAADDVWAVGEAGTSIHYDGGNWTRVAVGTVADLSAVWGLAKNDVWAVSHAGEIFHFDGAAWTLVKTEPNTDFSAVWASSATDVWAVGNDTQTHLGKMDHFDGTQWSLLADATKWAPAVEVWGSSASDVYFTTDGGALHWDGSQLSRIDVLGLAGVATGTGLMSHALWGSGPNDVWMAGNDPTGALTFRFDGTHWTKIPVANSTYGAELLWGDGKGNLWASANEGVFAWNGTTWTLSASSDGLPYPLVFNAAFATPGGDSWLVGKPGALYHLANGTLKGNLLTSRDIYRVWGSSTSDVWVEPYGDDALLNRNGGVWSTQSFSFGPEGVWGTAPDDVWALGQSAARFDGNRWTPVTAFGNLLGNGRSAYTGWGTKNDFWLGGESVLLHFDGSTAVNAIADMDYPQIWAFWGSAPNDIWAAGNFTYRYDGTTWQKQSFTDLERGVWGSSASDVWFVGEKTMRHWNGTAFDQVTPTATALSAIWGKAANDVYAVGDQGTILHYDGAKWSNQESGTTHTLVTIWGQDDAIVIGGEGAVILRHGVLGNDKRPPSTVGCDPGTAGCVACGVKNCSGGQTCCGQASPTCVAAGQCQGDVVGACDGEEDCPFGETCCVDLDFGASISTAKAVCAATCSPTTASDSSGYVIHTKACNQSGASECADVVGEFGVNYPDCCFVPGFSTGACVSETDATVGFAEAGGFCL